MSEIRLTARLNEGFALEDRNNREPGRNSAVLVVEFFEKKNETYGTTYLTARAIDEWGNLREYPVGGLIFIDRPSRV